MLRRTPQMLEKIKNRCKKNFKDQANMQLDKEDTRRSNLNSKHVSKTLVLKYPDSFYLFLWCSMSLIVKYDLIAWHKA